MDGDEDHEYVREQRRVEEAARREEKARRPPARKAAALRKELASAYDALGGRFVEIETFADQIKEL